ncbi:MAG TPA: glycosyltransferase [Herpetosiphonaceae bacterium]
MLKRFAGFSMVGGLVFLLGAAVLALGVEALRLPVYVAYAIQAVVSIEASFFLNRRLNWRERDGSMGAQWLRFHGSKVVTVALDQSLFALLLWGGVHYMAANVATTALLMVWNYVANDRFVFRAAPGDARQLCRRASTVELSVILPTYNEPGIGDLLAELTAALEPGTYEVLVVDDSPSDITASIVRQVSAANPAVRLIRGPREGLGVAMLLGAAKSTGAYVLDMDSDGQHPVAVVPELLRKARQGYDVVFPSRYLAGGSPGGLDGAYRRLASWGLRLLPRVMFPRRLWGVSDALGGFFIVRRDSLDLERMRPKGWKFSLEVLLFARINCLAEIPYAFGARMAGETKANWRIGLQYFQHLLSLAWRYYAAVPRSLPSSAPGRPLPRVGIVIPARQSEGVIRGCVEGLLAQDYQGEFFITIVGSPNDSTFAPIQEFIASGRVIPVEVSHPDPTVRDANMKRLAGRNKAIQLGAEVIFFTDTKIRFPHNTLSRAVAMMQEQGVAAVAGTMAAWPEQRRAYWARVLDQGLITEMPRFGQGRLLTSETLGKSMSLPITSCFLVDARASRMASWPMENHRYVSHEDSRIALALMQAGHSILASDKLVVFHKHRTDWQELSLKWRRAGYTIGAMLRDEPDNAFVQSRARKAGLVIDACGGAIVTAIALLMTFGLAGLWLSLLGGLGGMLLLGLANVVRARSLRMLLVPWGTALLILVWTMAFLQGRQTPSGRDARERMLQIH